MVDGTEPKPRVSGFLVGVTLTLLALCLIPIASRRLLICLARVFSGVQYGDLHAVGQPPGCTYHIVPSFELSKACLARWESQAASDADSFMMMLGRWPAHQVVPDLALFDDHPAQQWAALRVAAATVRFGNSKKPSPEYVQSALAFVERARRAHSENGALWLGEAVLYVELGLDDVALEMFREAGRHPRWDCQPGMYRHVYELLVAEGMLPLNAAVESERAADLDFGRIDNEANWCIDQLLARFIREKDPTRFAELSEAAVALQACEWQGVHSPNRLRSFPCMYSGTAALEMSDVLSESELSGDVLCNRMDLEMHAFCRHSDSVVGPELTNRLLPTRDEKMAYFSRARGVRFEEASEFWWNFQVADALGNLSLIVMAGLGTVCMIMCAVRRRRAVFDEPGTGFQMRWRRLVVILPICVWFFHSALSHRVQSIGLRSMDTRDPPLLEISIVIAVLVCIFASLLLVITRYRQGHVNLLLLTSSGLFVCVLVCSHFRAALTEIIQTRTRQSMTQEYIPWANVCQGETTR